MSHTSSELFKYIEEQLTSADSNLYKCFLSLKEDDIGPGHEDDLDMIMRSNAQVHRALLAIKELEKVINRQP